MQVSMPSEGLPSLTKQQMEILACQSTNRSRHETKCYTLFNTIIRFEAKVGIENELINRCTDHACSDFPMKVLKATREDLYVRTEENHVRRYESDARVCWEECPALCLATRENGYPWGK